MDHEAILMRDSYLYLNKQGYGKSIYLNSLFFFWYSSLTLVEIFCVVCIFFAYFLL